MAAQWALKKTDREGIQGASSRNTFQNAGTVTEKPQDCITTVHAPPTKGPSCRLCCEERSKETCKKSWSFRGVGGQIFKMVPLHHYTL